MVTKDGQPIPPPSDEQLDATLWRVHDSVTRRLSERSGRASRGRRWAGVMGGVVLFGAGIAVGGAAVPVLTSADPSFEVRCFASVTDQTAEVTVGFDTATRVGAARADPVAACENVQIQIEYLNGIDPIITGLLDQGHNCGAVTTGGGQVWSYQKSADGSLGVTNGKFEPALPPDCVTVHVPRVAPPLVTSLGGVACAAGDTRVNVYPGGRSKATSICRSHGYLVYEPTPAG